MDERMFLRLELMVRSQESRSRKKSFSMFVKRDFRTSLNCYPHAEIAASLMTSMLDFLIVLTLLKVVRTKQSKKGERRNC